MSEINNEEFVNNKDSNKTIKKQGDIVQECLNLLRSLVTGKKKKKKKSWFQRAQTNQLEWKRNRPFIWEHLYSQEVIAEKCCVCKEEKPIIKCNDCFQNQLCYKCDFLVHKDGNSFHDRYSFHDGFFQPLSPMELFKESPECEDDGKTPDLRYFSCHQCKSFNLSKLVAEEMCIVVTLKGRYDLFKYNVVCSDCGAIFDPFTLEVILDSGYWPGSPVRINYLIKEDVFVLWDTFRKRMPGSSERAFLLSLCDISKENGRKGVINHNSFSMAFKEWNFWKYKKDVSQGLNWIQCPPCEIQQHCAHVDGNFKLYRYGLSKRKRQSFYEDVFFCPNEDVRSYLKKLYPASPDTSKVQNDYFCGGNWTAAKNIKRKSKSLDETGLEAATCRHRVAQKALNMHQGELFGYPLYLMKNYMIPKNVEFCFADVMCKLWTFFTRNEPSLKDCIKPGLSVMHAQTHADDCKVLWSGEWINKTGKSTGEETEQFFGHISRCGSVTKHQTPENREETITEMVFGWNRRKILNIVEELKRRYLKVEIDIKNVLLEVNEVKHKTGLNFKDKDAMKWLECIKESAKGIKKTRGRKTLLDSERALLLCNDLHKVKKPIQKLLFPKCIKPSSYYRLLQFCNNDKEREYERLDALGHTSDDILLKAYDSLKTDVWKPLMQLDIEKLSMEKVVYSSNLKKMADTSKRRHLLRGKQAVVKNKIKDIVSEYCLLYGINDREEFTEQLEKGVFYWLQSDAGLIEGTASDRRLCVETFLKKQHLYEEKEILLTEMKSSLLFFTTKVKELSGKYDILQHDLDENSHENNNPDDINMESIDESSVKGQMALIRKGLAHYKLEIERALFTFGPYIDTDGLTSGLVTNFESENEEVDSTDDSEENEESEEENTELTLSEINYESIDYAGKQLSAAFSFVDCTINTYDCSSSLYLPSGCSQDKLNGANGSNACAIIALLMGSMLCRTALPIDISDTDMETLYRHIVPLFCGAIDFGNLIYDLNCAIGFLHVKEASDMLPPSIAFDIMFERNVFISGYGEDSLYQFVLSVSCDINCFIVAIFDSKAFLLYVSSDKVIVVDSHSHNDLGGKIMYLDINDASSYEAIYDTLSVGYVCLLKCNNITKDINQ